MTKYGTGVKQPAKLQARAEEFLNKNLSAIKKTPPRDVRNLFEDLQIYQTELENRNEALYNMQRELQLARDKYSVLYEFAPIGYFTINEEGLILETNYTCASLLDIDKGDLVGKYFQSFIAKDSLEIFHELCGKILGEKTKQSKELKLRKKDGAEIFCHLEGLIGQCATGELMQIRMVVTDISERKRAEQERKKVQARLQHVSRMKALTIFAGGIAHEFNNILGIILGNTENAIEGVSRNDPVRKNLTEVYSAAFRAKDVVKQILAFSHNSEVELKPVRMGKVVGEAVKLIRSASPAGIEVRHSFLHNSDIIYADPTQLQQMLLNLCSNAFHSMAESGGGILKIHLEDFNLDESAVGDYNELQPGTYLKLTVSDTGEGMDSHIADRIFDPCFSTKEMEEGPGMGLAVTYGIVKNHGGDIAYQSEIGNGTVFQVLLPVIQDTVVCEEVGVQPKPEGCERVLLVDDEEILLTIVKENLNELGYDVYAETRAVKALEAFKNNPDFFDIVVTDMSMPEITGDNLAREVLNTRPDIPIVLCTGFSERLSERETKDMGIRAFVMKPILAGELAGIIRDVLDVK